MKKIMSLAFVLCTFCSTNAFSDVREYSSPSSYQPGKACEFLCQICSNSEWNGKTSGTGGVTFCSCNGTPNPCAYPKNLYTADDARDGCPYICGDPNWKPNQNPQNWEKGDGFISSGKCTCK